MYNLIGRIVYRNNLRIRLISIIIGDILNALVRTKALHLNQCQAVEENKSFFIKYENNF